MARSKTCFKCNQEKPLHLFYKHPNMADGHLNKCIACAKKDVTKHRGKNLPKIRAYDRARASLPHRKEASKRYLETYRRRHKKREIATRAVAYAIRRGYLRKKPCLRCGSLRSVAHHENYDKMLDVMWLCQPCHKARHKELKAMKVKF